MRVAALSTWKPLTDLGAWFITWAALDEADRDHQPALPILPQVASRGGFCGGVVACNRSASTITTAKLLLSNRYDGLWGTINSMTIFRKCCKLLYI